MAKRPAWSTALPRPITIPQVMTLKTLADVRKLLVTFRKNGANFQRGTAGMCRRQ
jgi:hypothetical protein